ncbi:nuclear speckle RNA-binding protein A-like [Solanum verrucosum]|uniref:nuclear speckle RNA-binding protein A-like n=1 Tax=Solanum verrucosum TaxID=315347 RepID=UPI0020D10261|nr:nuclear speckle RNA-binding protein A-like [Solanum verrucosum]
MADAYRKDTNGGQQAVASPDLTPLLVESPFSEYEVPSSPEYPGYYDGDDERGMMRSTASIEASYEHYLRTGQILSHESIHSGIMGIEDVGMVGGRPEATLPPNASSTLYVEGLPADCTRREVAHIFRHFGGYKEVRLVPKPSIHAGANTLILCFVDFVSPLHAAAAMDTLQGYQFDLDEYDSGNLMLEFARNPGARSGGRNRGKC